MKTITDDPEAFFETGGWTFLDPESGSERGGSDEESEEDEYAPTDVDDEEDDESDSEYSEADSSDMSEDSDSGSEDGAGGSSDESGKDWSDLEREAAEADRENVNFEDEYSRSRGGKGGVAPPTSKRCVSATIFDDRGRIPFTDKYDLTSNKIPGFVQKFYCLLT